MSKHINGGPAFPIVGYRSDVIESGLTLRDYFAAKAMQAQLARTTWGVEDAARDMAEEAYAYADAMLAAREVTK